MLAGFAWWGFHIAHGVLGWLLAVAVPGVALVLWGRFLAPKAPRRPKGFMLAFLRFDALILGAIAAYMAGAVSLGIATAVCAVVGSAMASGADRDPTHLG